MVQVRSAAEATAWLRDDRADLVIADLADGSDGAPVAETLLTTMRREDLRAPVVVLSQHPVTAAERLEVISLGASEVAVGWADLFRELARIFAT